MLSSWVLSINRLARNKLLVQSFDGGLIIARIAREGQLRTPKAYILADKGFIGDQMAFAVKQWREQEEKKMSEPFTDEMLLELDQFESWYVVASQEGMGTHEMPIALD